MQSRGYPPESSSNGSGDESKTQNDRHMLRQNMSFWQKCLPKGNTCSTSFNEAKKIVCPLDLPHVRYHVYVDNCIIYRHEYAESTVCPNCDARPYKKKKTSPQKMVWYFPIIPCLPGYFAWPKQAKLMRWHEKRKEQKEEAEKMIQKKT